MNAEQKKEFGSFVVKSFLLLLFFIVLIRMFFYLSPAYSFPWAELLPISYFLLSALLHYFLIKASAQRPQQFISFFMAGLFAKLFLSLGFIIVFALIIKGAVVSFLISAIVIYFSFTFLEVVSLLKYLNGINGS